MLFAPAMLQNPDEEEKSEEVNVPHEGSDSDSPRAAPGRIMLNTMNCAPQTEESARIPRTSRRRAPIYDQAFKMAREMITNI